MSNFCPHCGTAVSENNAKNCVSCGKILSGNSEISKNDSLNETKEKLFNFAKNVKELSTKVTEDLRSDETKAKIKDFANQAQSFASEKTKDLKEELEKINEARKATANESSSLNADSKLGTAQAIGASFWSKLTGKQKGILIGTTLLTIVLIGSFLDDGKSGGSEFNSNAMQKEVHSRVGSILIDPNSAQYRNERFVSIKLKEGGYMYVVCGEVNSKNKMGGYVGFQGFEYVVDTSKQPPSKDFFFPTSPLMSVGKCLSS
jgi:hypothetical protein